MNASSTKLADLVDMDFPQAVFDEVLFITTLLASQIDPSQLTNAFGFTLSLYQGYWPSERACNTGFHDLRHITDTLLAMARLLHGASLNGHRLSQRHIFIGLVSAMAHDAGYLQDKKDGFGTGAKYTAVHVKRSMDFVERYGKRYGMTTEEVPISQLLVQCTDLDTDVAGMTFPSNTVALLGKLLACADLIGQMADRIYLEKLFFLYREFREGKVQGYRDEIDLLHKTLSFFDFVAERLKLQLGGVDRWLTAHFRSRWHISKNLYQVAMNEHKRYLAKILEQVDHAPETLLRRKRIVYELIRKQKSNPQGDLS